MAKFTRISAYAGLSVLGAFVRQERIWQTVAALVRIPQKTRRHTPTDKLLDAFITILAGGRGLVEVNSRVRPEPGLQRAFGRPGCADQSTVSRTLDACTPTQVAQLRQAVERIQRRYGRVCHHPLDRASLILDIDLEGLLSGRTAEGATRGYFPEHKRGRGRQLGRVYAPQTDEIVFEKLYPGNRQLPQVLAELVQEGQRVLGVPPAQHARLILRVDAGGGSDGQINALLEQGYRVLTKVTNYQRCAKLVQSVPAWFPDPTRPDRQLGWVEAPHAYAGPTRQLAIRAADPAGQWHYQVLVSNVDPQDLGRPTPAELAGALVHFYDQRGGGVEIAYKNSNQGLGLRQRNKRKFAAQEMLVLLAQLAYNLLSWVRVHLGQTCPPLGGFGPLRLIREVFHIPGKVAIGPPHRLVITLPRNYPWSAALAQTITPLLVADDTQIILRQI